MDEIIQAWAAARLNNQLYTMPRRGAHSLHYPGTGDILYSYGTHFPLVQLLRTPKGRPRGWLLNGDRWSGASGWSRNSTSDHQAAVLRYVRDKSRLPHFTVPWTVMDEAGIDTATAELVDRTSDRYVETIHDFTDETLPASAKWRYDDAYGDILPGTYGYIHKPTGEWFPRGKWGQDPRTNKPSGPHIDYATTTREERDAAWAAHWEAEKAWESEWQDVPMVRKCSGHKRLYLTGHHHAPELELYDDGDGVLRYTYTTNRHWLGESVMRAAVPYTGRTRCTRCAGTGVVPRYAILLESANAEGPLDERDSRREDSYAERWPSDEPRPRVVAGTDTSTTCRNCGGSKWTGVRRRRWAYFLSGFDANETRESYFFCELPPHSHPTTVSEAYATLEPAAVRLAVELGREVQRQGDMYWIPMPGLTLDSLVAEGGEHRHRGGTHLEKVRFSRGEFMTPHGDDAHLLATNHTATDVVVLGGATYAKGMLRHEPNGRRPDHTMIRLGDRKTWGLVVKNLVPTT